MKNLIALVVAPTITCACWAFSLRRTPYRFAWFALSLVWILLSLAAGLGGAEDPNATIAGLLAIAGAMSLIPVFAAFCTEFSASDAPRGAIALYRRTAREGFHTRVRLPRRPRLRPERWYVDNVYTPNGIRVRIRRGDAVREIGIADPILDEDAFLDVKVQAIRAAATMNALKIGSE